MASSADERLRDLARRSEAGDLDAAQELLHELEATGSYPLVRVAQDVVLLEAVLGGAEVTLPAVARPGLSYTFTVREPPGGGAVIRRVTVRASSGAPVAATCDVGRTVGVRYEDGEWRVIDGADGRDEGRCRDRGPVP